MWRPEVPRIAVISMPAGTSAPSVGTSWSGLLGECGAVAAYAHLLEQVCKLSEFRLQLPQLFAELPTFRRPDEATIRVLQCVPTRGIRAHRLQNYVGKCNEAFGIRVLAHQASGRLEQIEDALDGGLFLPRIGNADPEARSGSSSPPKTRVPVRGKAARLAVPLSLPYFSVCRPAMPWLLICQ